MAQLLGGIIGVYCFSIFFNFVAKKIRKSDTVKQRIVTTIAATVFAMCVWTLTSLSIQETLSYILNGIAIYLIGGIVTSYVFALKGINLTNKQISLAVLYTILGWFVFSLIFSFVISVIWIGSDEIYMIIGVISMCVSAILAPTLVIKKKLPFSKIKVKGDSSILK